MKVFVSKSSGPKIHSWENWVDSYASMATVRRCATIMKNDDLMAIEIPRGGGMEIFRGQKGVVILFKKWQSLDTLMQISFYLHSIGIEYLVIRCYEYVS